MLARFLRLPAVAHRFTATLLALIFVIGVGWPRAATAQLTIAQVPLKDRFDAGRSALQSDEHDTAVHLLSSVVDEKPSYRSRRDGAAAYWLGEAHAARGDSSRARSVWRMGMYALENEGHTDLSLVDAYVRETFRQQAHTEYVPAARAYLRLLRRASADHMPGSGQRMIRRHVAQMTFLLPDSLRASIVPDADAFQKGKGTLADGAGPALVRWWNRNDPKPATSVNERVVEHLQRVAEAEQRFTADNLRSFDDRGEIYVRLGAPDIRRELTSTSLARSVSNRSAFTPQNEYWRYQGFGRHSHYLFVKRGGRYQISGVPDLLPSGLRHTLSGSGALAALALYDYYNVFVPRVPEYFPLFDQVDDMVAQLKRTASLQRTTVARLADSNFDPASGESRYLGPQRPFFQEARRVEREVAQIRENQMPTVRSEVAPTSTLPVSVRMARFLRDDGTTRTEVYWSIADEALRSTPEAKQRLVEQGGLPSDERMLQLTTIRYGSDYQDRAKRRMHIPIAASGSASEAHVFSLTLPSSRGQHHLALQWDQYLVPEAHPPSDSSAWIHAGTGLHWRDSLFALPSDPGELVLSDLVPLRADSLHQVAPIRSDSSFRLAPYPYETLTADTKLAFYVEAYHLAFGADDQTRYTVAYEVQRRSEAKGLRRMVQSDMETITTASTTYRGNSRTAREYVVLDPSAWDASGTLRVTVRITDETTGDHAERSLTFDLQQ